MGKRLAGLHYQLSKPMLSKKEREDAKLRAQINVVDWFNRFSRWIRGEK